MNGICPDLVQALQSSRENEGDSERLRIALNGVDLLAVDPAGEMLMVMRAASVHVKNGRPQITMICQRVATGNEYRDWQQSGSVPQFAGDAGSSPAVGAFSHKRRCSGTAGAGNSTPGTDIQHENKH